MRIAYYCRFLDSSAGPGVHARALVRAWTRDGHEVLCLPRGPRAAASSNGQRRRLAESLPPALRVAGAVVKDRLRAPREATVLRQALRAFGPDVMVARRTWFDAALDRAVGGVACPVVAEVNAVTWKESEELSGVRLPGFVRRAEDRFYRSAVRCACMSEEVGRDVIALGVPGSRVLVLPNGVDASLFTPDVLPRSVRSLPVGATPLLGFVGTSQPSHDLPTMAAASRLLLAQEPAAAFLFVGLDPTHLRAAGFTEEVLRRSACTGPVGHEEVPGWLAAADILWAALRHSHGSPLKLMEYMAMGKPVVAACAGQAADCIASASCGRVVERGDSAGLARAVSEVARSGSAARALLGEAGRAWVVAHRDWQVVARRMIEGIAPPRDSDRGGRF